MLRVLYLHEEDLNVHGIKKSCGTLNETDFATEHVSLSDYEQAHLVIYIDDNGNKQILKDRFNKSKDYI